MRPSTALLLLVFGFAASLSSLTGCSASADACGGCKGATLCEPASKTCVPALAEGQVCSASGSEDAGQSCASGLSCLALGAGHPSVCGHTCDNTGGCSGTEQCAALGNAATSGICIQSVGVGQACAPDSLTQCLPPAVCLLSSAAATGGTCFDTCDPTQADAGCAAGTSCLPVFTTADAGVCATPVASGEPCAIQADAFCPQDSLCLQAADLDAGSCFPRCEATNAGACPELQHCLSFTGSLSFCAQPQALGQPCSVDRDLFCDNGALCISTQGGAANGTCAQDCSDGGVCPAGETCASTSDATVRFCG